MIYVRGLWQDLCNRSLCNVSVQDLHKGCPGKISVQDLYKRSLGKTLQKIPVQALYKSSVGKISVRGLLARSLHKICVRALCTRSLKGLRELSIKDLLVKISAISSTIKISTAPRKRTDTPKVPRGCANHPKMSSATTRAI